MEQEVQLEQELEKLKNAPQSIDFFMKVMRQKLGENEGTFKQIIEKAIGYYQETNEQAVYGKLLLLKIEWDLLYGNYNEAIKLGQEASRCFETSKNTTEMIEVQDRLLNAYMKKGQFKQAFWYRRQALEKLNEAPNPTLHMMLMFTTVKLYIVLKDYKRAKDLLKHIEEMDEWLTPKDELQLNILLLEIALEEEQVEEAIEYASEAYHLVSESKEEGKYDYTLGKVLRLRARLNAKRKLQMQAEKDFKAATEHSAPYKESYIETLLSWKDYLIEENQVKVAEEKVNEAIEIAKLVESPYFLVKTYSALNRIYEMNNDWKEAYKVLRKIQGYQAQIVYDKADLENDVLDKKQMIKEQGTYQTLYKQLQKIAYLGQRLTANLTLENLQEVIQKEITDLINIDVMGIGMIEDGKLQYNMYELQEGWLPSTNDLVRYTIRLAEHCTQFQTDIIVNNGNFEEYSLKHINNSHTSMQLQSMIVMNLKVENEVVGAMTIGSYQKEAYSPKDIEMAKIIASYLGFTLKNTCLYQEINYLTEHDVLTGLLSRSVVLKNGEKLFKENHKKHKKTAIMMLDMDSFKQINQKYGYELGDEVLSKIGAIIRKHIQAENYVGRYGGKEFIAILNNLEQKEVTQIAEDIRMQLLETTFETKKEKNIKVTLSGGIYICNEYTLNFDDAIRFADHALYRAKLLGRNRIMNYNLRDIK